jgi:hypothetical protein
LWVKFIDNIFPPRRRRGAKEGISTILWRDHFFPAVGWEKVIKIRRFSNGTAIVITFEKSL